MWVLVSGNLSVDGLENVCQQHQLDPKKVIFLFPGNSSHHSQHADIDSFLYKSKSGGGLAALSGQWGAKKYPTLSLPTTHMENWSTNVKTKAIVSSAIADLEQAQKAGYHFILPVRKHANQHFFVHGLAQQPDFEPSFWGGIQAQNNIPLASYYIPELNKLMQNEPVALVNPKNAPVQSKPKKQNTDSPAPSKPKIDKPEAPKVKPSLFKIPESYSRIYDKQDDPLLKARELLNDYTKNNSLFLRIFTFHAFRNHAYEVNRLVERIDKKIINDVDQLIVELKRIALVNNSGSLARRIEFIQMNNKGTEEQAAPAIGNNTL